MTSLPVWTFRSVVSVSRPAARCRACRKRRQRDGNDRVRRPDRPACGQTAGGNDHRYALPLSALLGAILLILSDTFARTTVLPGGAFGGDHHLLLGAPFFPVPALQEKRKARLLDQANRRRLIAITSIPAMSPPIAMGVLRTPPQSAAARPAR